MGARQNDWDDEPTCVANLSREEIDALMRNADRMESGIQSKEPMPVVPVDVPRPPALPEDLEDTVVGMHPYAASAAVDMNDHAPFDLRRVVESRKPAPMIMTRPAFEIAPPPPRSSSRAIVIGVLVALAFAIAPTLALLSHL
jgi:hypothetical protein